MLFSGAGWNDHCRVWLGDVRGVRLRVDIFEKNGLHLTTPFGFARYNSPRKDLTDKNEMGGYSASCCAYCNSVALIIAVAQVTVKSTFLERRQWSNAGSPNGPLTQARVIRTRIRLL